MASMRRPPPVKADVAALSASLLTAAPFHARLTCCWLSVRPASIRTLGWSPTRVHRGVRHVGAAILIAGSTVVVPSHSAQSPGRGNQLTDRRSSLVFLSASVARNTPDLCGLTQRLIDFAVHPQVVEQCRELARYGDDGAPLACRGALAGEAQPPSPQVAVLPE